LRGVPASAIESLKSEDATAPTHECIDLGIGELDFDIPEHVRIEACAAIARGGHSRYTPSNGTDQLRIALRTKLSRDNGIFCDDDQLAVGCGAKQVIFNALLATLEPGDEVIVSAPYWAPYISTILCAGGVPVVIPTDADRSQPTVDALVKLVSRRTKWLFLNSPNNPTGTLLDRDDLQAIAEGLSRWKNVLVMSDEVCDSFCYDRPHCSFAAFESSLSGRILTVNSLSKSYAMAGWRIGYGVGPKDLIRAIEQVACNSTIHPSSISQAAAVAALCGPQDCLVEFRKQLRRRRDLVCSSLARLSGLEVMVPEGGIFVCAKYTTQKSISDAQFCREILRRSGVYVLPGSSFGIPGTFRLSLGRPEEILAEASAKLTAVWDQIMDT
jgi:aspartate aminotransferase